MNPSAFQAPNILIDYPNLDESLLDPNIPQSLKDAIITAALHTISSPLVPQAYHKYLYSSLSYVACVNLSVFCSNQVIESMANGLYGVIDMSRGDISLKRHSLTCLLTAKILHKMYQDTEGWPTRFAIAWVYDMLRYRLWADSVWVAPFVREIKTAFMSPEDLHAQHLRQQGASPPQDELPTPRYRQQASIDEIWSLAEKEITQQINKSDAKQLIPLIIQLIRIPGVRAIGVMQLEKWLVQPNHFRLAKEFLSILPAHVTESSEHDLQIVNALAVMKVKPNMVPLFVDCISRIVKNNPQYPSLIMSRYVYQELQSTSITNTTNMTLMHAAFSGIDNEREKCLGLVLRDVAAKLNQPGTPQSLATNPMLNKVARRIAKVLAPILDLAVFSGWLLQESGEMLNATRDAKERWLSQLVQVLTTFCATVAVERGIPASASSDSSGGDGSVSGGIRSGASAGANHSPSPVLPGSATSHVSSHNSTPGGSTGFTPTPQQQTLNDYQFRRVLATVNNVAIAWIFLTVVGKYLPDLSPDRLLYFVHHVLFLEPPSNYAQVDSQQELRIMEYWFHELPCDENSFHQLAYASITEGTLSAEQFFNTSHKLVIRAARLQRTLQERGFSIKEYNCLPIQSVELVRAVFHLCMYTPAFLHHQSHVKPPQSTLWLRQYLWKACLIVAVIVSLNCDSDVGAYGWQLPTMNNIMKMLLTETGHNIEAQPGWNILPGERESVEQYCTQMVDILNKINVEHAFFQNGSIEKWIQLLTVPNEESPVRHPPAEVLHEISQLDKSLHLGAYLRASRHPDYLLQVIQEKGSQEAMPWLSDVLQREPHILNGLPVDLLCEILMQTLAIRAPGDSTVSDLVQCIAVRLVTQVMSAQADHPDSVSQMLHVMEFFLGRLADPQSELVQANAQKALRLIFVENFREMEGSTGEENTTVSSWLQRLPKIPALLDHPHGRNMLASTFSAYAHHGSDANFMGAFISFAIAQKILSPVKLSLEISSLFKNRPHFVAKFDWESNDSLRLVTETFTTAYSAFKKTQNVPPHHQDIANTRLLILQSGMRFRLYPLFLEGYLFLLTLLVSKQLSSSIEDAIIEELLAENTTYENGVSVVTPQLARSFFSVEHAGMLQSALRTLKTEDPQSILMALTSLKRGEIGGKQIRAHFDGMSDEQLRDSLLSLRSHQMDVFLISLGHIEQFYPNFAQRARSILQRESMRQTGGDSLLPEEVSPDYMDVEEAPWDVTSERHLLDKISTPEELDTKDVLNSLNNALLREFFAFVVENTSSVAMQTLQNILLTIASSVHTGEDQSIENVKEYLLFVLTKIPQNISFERLFLWYMSLKVGDNDFAALLLEIADECLPDRRDIIFEFLIGQYPSLNHDLLWKNFVFAEDDSNPSAPNTLASPQLREFEKMRDVFIECATYESVQNVIDLLSNAKANHRRVLDIVLAVRHSMYSSYKYLRNTKLFPQWEASHMKHLVQYFIGLLASLSRAQSSDGKDLISVMLRDEQQAQYLSLLQEACTQDKKLLQLSVRFCEKNVREDNDAHIIRASQTLLAWLYSCFPFSLGHFENLTMLRKLSIPTSMVSALDKPVHRLCQYLRTRSADPFMFQMLRMLSATYPNLVLRRFGAIEALLEFGYSTSIDQFMEKQLSQTYEQVLYILHALKPQLFRFSDGQITTRQLHSVFERYFTIMRRLPSEQFSNSISFLNLLIDLLLAYKKESPESATEFLNQNEFVLTRIRSECGSKLENLHLLTSVAHDTIFLTDCESIVDGTDAHTPHYDSILRMLQYKNVQHRHNSVEINAHNMKLIDILTALSSEQNLESSTIKILTRSMLRLCTAQDTEVRRLSYNLILRGIRLDPLNYQNVLPTYLKLFSFPDVEVRRHAIAHAQEFTPYAGEYTQQLLQALFEAEKDGIQALTSILHRMHPIVS
uniref:Uncharacterized protein n=1 Tax=Percolomonas cosmopolitus TaxID=63605 RepID=A0A6U0JV01_9EUKA